MAKLIKEREKITQINKRREFIYLKDRTAGFTFEVDKNNNPIFYSEAAKTNYDYCLLHPEKYEDMGIITFTTSYIQPAIYQCSHCKQEIEINGDTQCDCGQWYNGFGQELLPREMWEED